MATPSQFTQVSAEQWAELPLQLVVVSEVFSPEIAQILTLCAQHGRDLRGASPRPSWPQRGK